MERFIERLGQKIQSIQVQSLSLCLKSEKEELPENTTEAVKFKFRTSKQSGINVLDVKNISHKYDGNLIFHDICLP